MTGTSTGRARPCLQSASARGEWGEGTRGSASRSVHNRARPRRMALATCAHPSMAPLSALPTMRSVMDEMRVNAEQHDKTSQKAQGRPHACDDALVARIVQGHTDQREDHGRFEHQRRGTTNAMVPAACGRTPPAAGSCGLWSRHAAWRRAALLGKALGGVCPVRACQAEACNHK